MAKFLPTAFAQLEFAWKLFAYVEAGEIDLEKLDQNILFEEGEMMFAPRARIFTSYDDLILACRNNLTVSFGAAAITLNRAREEADIPLPDPIVSDVDQFVSLAYQIRNAFAHDIAEPKWSLKSPRYRRVYEFGGLTVDLTNIIENQHFTYEAIGGPDTMVSMYNFFTEQGLARL
jgi:hypothetical protein